MLCLSPIPSVRRWIALHRVISRALITLAGAASFSVCGAPAALAQGSSLLTFHGSVSSATHPVTESIVVLYAAGSTGYGSKPKVLDLTLTDLHGNFRFPLKFRCPASPGDQVYVVAAGGNAGAGFNFNTAMMTGLGSCSSLNTDTNVVINEVTTVASVYALSPFMTTAGDVGASATNYAGLANAMKTVRNLVDISSGAALTITPAYVGNPVPYLNSSTVPQARIDTLANMLAGCVETDGTRGSSTACSSLFTAATPAGGSAPANTLQAALNIAQNPGANVASLFTLAGSSPAYQPSLLSAPNDWMLALTFTGAGLGVPPGGTEFVQNNTLSIDANGNLFVSAGGVNDGVPTGHNLVAEFDNLGTPLTPATTLSGAMPPVVDYGGFQDDNNLPGVHTNSAAVDSNGNLWLSGGDLFEVATSPSLSLVQEVVPRDGANSVAFDKNGNIWLSNANTVIEQFDASGNFLASYPTPAPSFRTTVNFITFDSSNNFWAQQSSAAKTFSYSSSTGTPAATYVGAGPFAADASGDILGCNSTKTGFNLYNASNTTAPVNTYTATGRCGSAFLFDGLGRTWALNSTSTGQFLDELSNTGAALSPATGFTGTSSSEANTIFSVSNPNSMAIDRSGNLWLLNQATGAESNTITGNVLVEYIGTAAPVVTPLATALQTNQLATRP